MNNREQTMHPSIRQGRGERMVQIIRALCKSTYDVHTVNSIAKLIGIKPSSHLRSILGDMASQGKLVTKTVFYDDGSVARRFYSLPARAMRQRSYWDFIVCPDCGSGNASESHECEQCGFKFGYLT